MLGSKVAHKICLLLVWYSIVIAQLEEAKFISHADYKSYINVFFPFKLFVITFVNCKVAYLLLKTLFIFLTVWLSSIMMTCIEQIPRMM